MGTEGAVKKEWKDYKAEAGRDIKSGYAVITYTDSFETAVFPLPEEAERRLSESFGTKLLDIRIFDESTEWHIFRSGADSSRFFARRLADDSCDGCDRYRDQQYMDIDALRSKNCGDGIVQASGGGRYRMPVKFKNDVIIQIINHIGYDECGQAYIKDWRLAGFKAEGE